MGKFREVENLCRLIKKLFKVLSGVATHGGRGDGDPDGGGVGMVSVSMGIPTPNRCMTKPFGTATCNL